MDKEKKKKKEKKQTRGERGRGELRRRRCVGLMEEERIINEEGIK